MDAEFCELAADASMAPARVLPRELQHQLPNLIGELGPPAPSGRLSPLPTYKRLVPAQQRPWRHQKHASRRTWEVAGRGCKQRPISRPQLWPRDLATQNLEFVAEHQQLDVVHVQAATATNERAEQSPKGEVKERKNHASDPPKPRPHER
jgi:hypothetical protein